MLSARRRVQTMRQTGLDAGITLSELLVTMTLVSIVAALSLSWLIGESGTDTKTRNISYATSGARAVLESWPALLRVADSPSNGLAALSGSPAPAPTTVAAGRSAGRFLALSQTSITFNANLGNAPVTGCGDTCTRGGTTQVTLALSGGALSQTIAKGTTTPATTVLIAKGAAAADAGGCLFTAFDIRGVNLGCTSSTPLGAIARVVLAFAVTPDSGGQAQTFRTSTMITGSFAADPAVSASPTAGA